MRILMLLILLSLKSVFAQDITQQVQQNITSDLELEAGEMSHLVCGQLVDMSYYQCGQFKLIYKKATLIQGDSAAKLKKFNQTVSLSGKKEEISKKAILFEEDLSYYLFSDEIICVGESSNQQIYWGNSPESLTTF